MNAEAPEDRRHDRTIQEVATQQLIVDTDDHRRLSVLFASVLTTAALLYFTVRKLLNQDRQLFQLVEVDCSSLHRSNPKNASKTALFIMFRGVTRSHDTA